MSYHSQREFVPFYSAYNIAIGLEDLENGGERIYLAKTCKGTVIIVGLLALDVRRYVIATEDSDEIRVYV